VSSNPAILLLIGTLLGNPLPAAGATPADSWQHLADEVVETGLADALPGIGVVIFADARPAAIATSWEQTTPFRWGSITKTLTALAALRLHELGQLKLDTPVRSYLPAGVVNNPWAATRPLTTRQLLEQSAGLPDLSREEWNSNQPLPLWQALERRNTRLLWPPGLQHSYSNVSPGLTAAVIEQATGRKFADVLHDQVLKPLGMSRASLKPLPGLPGGFQADGSTPIPYWHMTFTAFGALNAPLPELARLLQMLLQHGRIDEQQYIQAASLAAVFSPGQTLGARQGLQVGYGAGLYSWISAGHQFWGHGGDADGYRSRFGLLPDVGRGYLIAINADRPALLRQLQRRLERALTADLTRPQVPLRYQHDSLEHYTGDYYPASARFNVAAWQTGDAPGATVTAAGDELRFRRGTRSTRLIAVGPGRFRRASDPAVTVVFASDRDGVLYLQGELGNYLKSDHCPGFIPPCHQ